MIRYTQNMDYDTDKLITIAEQAAIKAGGLLREGFSAELEKRRKTSMHDIVTIYDTKAEESVFSTIRETFPDHVFLGEESGLSGSTQDKVTWIVDPIDGTINFYRKIPLFSVSIAAVYNEEVLCGVVYNPITDELFSAQKGKGAFLNGQKINVSSIANMNEGIYAIGFPYEMSHISEKNVALYFKVLNQGAPIRNLGSGALSLAYVAAGKIDAFWIPSLYAWDMAAGMLLVTEAGGIVTSQTGKNFEKIATTDALDILATNRLLHDKILTELT
jgi:myo-inositol-1(or 4)-monophosphatase